MKFLNFEIKTDSTTKYIFTVIILFVLLGFGVNSCTHDNFKEVCDKSGGVTVWDGRQYQCINAIPATIKSK